MEIPNSSNWETYLNNDELWNRKRFEQLLAKNPNLEYLLEQVPTQTTEQIFSTVNDWNTTQKIPAAGIYTTYRFDYKGTDGKLTNFMVKEYSNGRITISISCQQSS